MWLVDLPDNDEHDYACDSDVPAIRNGRRLWMRNIFLDRTDIPTRCVENLVLCYSMANLFPMQ